MLKDWFDQKKGSTGAVIGIAGAVLAVVLIAAYMGLCVWVQGNDQLLPGTALVDGRGGVVSDLGKLTREEALDIVSEAMLQQMDGRGLTLLYGEDTRVELSDSLVSGSAESAVDLGFATKNSKPNWKLGLLWLGAMKEPVELPLSSSALTPQGEAQAKKLAVSIAEELYVPPVDFTYELGVDSMVVTPGTDGSAVDAGALLEAMKEALSQGLTELRVEPQPVSGAELSGEALRKLVRVEPKPAGVDGDGNLVSAVVGLSVNAEAAQKALDAAVPGEPCTIPLEVTPPAPAEEESMFYQDLLAEYTSELSGDAAPQAAETAAACNGKTLQPGEVFSCLDAFGTGGQAIIHQAASSLYYCALYSNLSIVERTGGTSVPGYIPAGLDAAVTASQDLKFRNSTGFPVKIAASADNQGLTVRFYGSNPDGIKVEVQRETRSTTSGTTVYQPDSSVPRGTTKESVASASGCVVEVYRCVYDASGKLLSRTLENTSTYEARDRVVLYNPADSGPWGTGTASRPNRNSTSKPSASKPSTSKPSTTKPSTPSPAPDPEPAPAERPPEDTMPDWLKPSTPETGTSEGGGSAPAPEPAPEEPSASMPDWLS